MSLHVDRSGTLWAGTFQGGLNRFNRKSESFTRFQNDPEDPFSLSFNGVTSILEDSVGEIWVGTFRGGLNRLDRETEKFSVHRHDPENPSSLSGDSVLALRIFFVRRRSGWLGLGRHVRRVG